MNYRITMLALIMTSCAVVEKDITDTGASAEMSECGQQVLKDDSWAYSSCFDGDDTYGACETCGYYSSPGESQGARDCITCEEGYAIDVVFSDCTGYCVPYGDMYSPATLGSCDAISECVYEE